MRDSMRLHTATMLTHEKMQRVNPKETLHYSTLIGYPNNIYNFSLVVYITSVTHTCIDKALLVAGLGEAQIRLVENDKLYRMNVRDLEKKLLLDIEVGLV